MYEVNLIFEGCVPNISIPTPNAAVSIGSGADTAGDSLGASSCASEKRLHVDHNVIYIQHNDL